MRFLLMKSESSLGGLNAKSIYGFLLLSPPWNVGMQSVSVEKLNATVSWLQLFRR